MEKMEGWKPTEVFRAQDKLHENAWMAFHGFVIIKVESGDSVQYVRLDWGINGLFYNVNDDWKAFPTYAEISQEGLTLKEGVAATALIGVPAIATGALLCAGEAVLAGLAGGAAAGAVALMASAEMDSKSASTNTWHPTRHGRTLGGLCEMLKDVKDKEYSVTSWNCNHLADYICDALLR